MGEKGDREQLDSRMFGKALEDAARRVRYDPDPGRLADRFFDLGLRYHQYQEMKRTKDPGRFPIAAGAQRQYEWLDTHPLEAKELLRYTGIRLEHERDLAWKIRHQLVIGEVLGRPVSAEWEDFQRYRDSAIAVAGLDAAESNLFGALGLGLAQATHPRGSYEYQVRAGELMSNVGKVLLGGMRMGAHKAAVKDRVLRDKSPSRRVYGKRVDGEWKPGQPLPFPKDPGYLLPIFPLITPTPQPDVTRAPTPALGRKSETAIDVQPWYGRAFRNQRETTKLIKRLNSLAAQPSQGPAVWHAAASATCEGLARSGKVLSLGSRGEDVKAVQRLLGMSRADQDAKWGPRTERRYQDRLRSYGLSGPQASPELFRRLAADAERLRTLAESGTLLRQGTSGDDVRLLQRALGMPTYLQDGKYGPQTARWVRRKQTEFGITRDSVAGPQTLTHLLRASAIGR